MSAIVHDWTTYNRWVDTVSNGVGRLRPPQASPTEWLAIAKAVAICVLAVGLAAAIMLWAWRDPKVVVPEIKVDVQQPIGVVPMPPAIAQPAEAPTDPGTLVRNFVLFTERAVSGVGTVVTGWKFDSENNPRPVEQWCYLTPRYGGEVGTIQRIDLPRSSVAIAAAAVLSRHRLTSTSVEKARQTCAWFQG